MQWVLLFVTSFLAGSFVPLSSESYVALLFFQTYPWEFLILVAALGNTFGGMSCYAIARYGGRALVKKYLKQTDDKINKWEQKLSGKGEWVAFFCWLPFVGEVLATTLGFTSNRWKKILVFMFLGKILRYAFVLVLLKN